MDHKQVLIDLRPRGAGEKKPLMLQPILFCPVISWVCQELWGCGVRRFFIVCDEMWEKEAATAVSGFDGVLFFPDAASALGAMAEGDALVISAPAVPVTAYGPSPVYTCPVDALRSGTADGRLPAERPPQAQDALSWLPVRSVAELNRAMPVCRDMLCDRLTEQGVSIPDITAVYIDPRVSVGPDVTLLPGTILRGHTVIGRGCEIGPNAMVRDCIIGEETTVNASQLNESRVGSRATVGPFAYVRPGCTVGDHCRIGDFVELKNSVLGQGTKVSHLTYVGDSDVGERVNFGCGTVTTNFNGLHKYRCTVGDDVFLGCNTNLIAPVTVGDGAYTAAGSTVTEDVPAGALAIARMRQSIKEGWVKQFMKGKK